MGKVIPHKKPEWCERPTCQYLRNGAGIMCIGKLPEPEPHGYGFNTHRLCMLEEETGEHLVRIVINKSDVGWFEYLFEVMKD